MYTDLNLYYLNQMGIRPWISKEYYAQENAAREVAAIKLLIIIQEKLVTKTQSLLDKIITYISVAEHEYKLVYCLDEARQLIDHKPSLCILSFGCVLDHDHALQGVSIIDAHSLAELLLHPIAKKKLFMNLCSLTL